MIKHLLLALHAAARLGDDQAAVTFSEAPGPDRRIAKAPISPGSPPLRRLGGYIPPSLRPPHLSPGRPRVIGGNHHPPVQNANVFDPMHVAAAGGQAVDHQHFAGVYNANPAFVPGGVGHPPGQFQHPAHSIKDGPTITMTRHLKGPTGRFNPRTTKVETVNHGPTRITHPSGDIYEGEYIYGKMEGPWKITHQGVVDEGLMVKGQKYGDWTRTTPNGVTEEITQFGRHEKKAEHGFRIQAYDDVNPHVKEGYEFKGMHVDGNRHGTSVLRGPQQTNGKFPFYEGMYIDGKRHGPFRERVMSKNGRNLEIHEGQYVNGHREGPWTIKTMTENPNGVNAIQSIDQGVYVAEKKSGPWTKTKHDPGHARTRTGTSYTKNHPADGSVITRPKHYTNDGVLVDDKFVQDVLAFNPGKYDDNNPFKNRLAKRDPKFPLWFN